MHAVNFCPKYELSPAIFNLSGIFVGITTVPTSSPPSSAFPVPSYSWVETEWCISRMKRNKKKQFLEERSSDSVSVMVPVFPLLK
jgi:hypothetical protein